MSAEIFKQTKILVCVGSGGVGKTTVAAALAVLAAKEGKKVLVLTIDPSKRLAQTLGIEGKKEITKVPDQNFAGELYASVIDHKKTFDEFVARAAKKSETIQKVYNNRLYQQLSTNLSGSQEFTALEKLFSVYESKEFDLIVLDTPPTKHAIDFLQAPQKLSALFNEGVAKWFRDPAGKKAGLLGQLMQTGTKQVLKILEMLTGSTFIQELGDFFTNIEQWQEQLLKRTVDVHRMMVAPSTHFCLVTSFDQAKLKEAEYFSKEIKKGGYHLHTVVLNRVFPYWLNLTASQDTPSGQQELVNLYSEMRAYYHEKDLLYQKFEASIKKEAQVFRIPDLPNDISDIKGLESFGELILEGEKKS